jgi:hypothetical protein
MSEVIVIPGPKAKLNAQGMPRRAKLKSPKAAHEDERSAAIALRAARS